MVMKFPRFGDPGNYPAPKRDRKPSAARASSDPSKAEQPSNLKKAFGLPKKIK